MRGRQALTPSELADGLALLGRVIDGDVLDEERTVARDLLCEIRSLLRDVRSGPDDVDLGRRVSLFKPAVTLLKLQCAAPRKGLEAMVKWADGIVGTRGERVLTPVSFVAVDGEWKQIILPNKTQDAGFQVFEREPVATP